MKKILSVSVVAFVVVGVVRAADGDPDLTVTPIAATATSSCRSI